MKWIWQELVDELRGEISELEIGQYLMLTYSGIAGFVQPHAQVAPTIGGLLCEAVPESVLSSEVWPIADYELRRRGWAEADQDHEYWWRYAGAPDECAQALVDGLRYGRLCEDLPLYQYWVGDYSVALPVRGRSSGPWEHVYASGPVWPYGAGPDWKTNAESSPSEDSGRGT
jgi:hypothetical protein